MGAPGWTPPSPPTDDPTRRALPRRYGAYIIDSLLALVIIPIVVVGYFALSTTRTVDDAQAYCDAISNDANDNATICTVVNDHEVRLLEGGQIAELVVIGGGLALVVSLNQWVLQGLTGASLGKHLLGLRVVRADGAIAGFGWNALRTLLLVVDASCYGVIGIVSSSVTHPHRRVGDMAAGTYVVPKDAVGRPIVAVPPPPPPPLVAPPQPQWDPARQAWVLYEPATGRWSQWDASAAQWRPL